MKRSLIIAGLCIVILLALLFGIDPTTTPSFVLVIPFLLIFIFILCVVSYLLERRGVVRNKSIQIAVLSAGIPLVLLVLQSIGQLTVRDVLTLTVLFVLSYFYISKAAASS